jgi:hypothetical protein
MQNVDDYPTDDNVKLHAMPHNPTPSLVTQAPDPAISLRRHMLVSSLFKYVADIQELDEGYAFKFGRSELVIRRIADYIVFEGQYSPQLTFVLVAEPEGSVLWLQVRGPESEKPHIRTINPTIQMRVSPPA